VTQLDEFLGGAHPTHVLGEAYLSRELKKVLCILHFLTSHTQRKGN
jgi:hypothetical protein